MQREISLSLIMFVNAWIPSRNIIYQLTFVAEEIGELQLATKQIPQSFINICFLSFQFSPEFLELINCT